MLHELDCNAAPQNDPWWRPRLSTIHCLYMRDDRFLETGSLRPVPLDRFPLTGFSRSVPQTGSANRPVPLDRFLETRFPRPVPLDQFLQQTGSSRPVPPKPVPLDRFLQQTGSSNGPVPLDRFLQQTGSSWPVLTDKSHRPVPLDRFPRPVPPTDRFLETGSSIQDFQDRFL